MLIALGTILVIWAGWMAVYDRRNFFLPYLLSFGAVCIALGVLIYPAASQHQHPPQDRAIHEKFYSTWMRPDNPNISCCNEKDCYPTEARKTADGWLARRREDGVWLSVPDNRIERNRDNPDGRNHLCAPPPIAGDTVYCFSVGGGT